MKTLAVMLALAASAAGQDDPGFKRPATLRAHFLLPDGTPAEGVSLRLRGHEGDAQRLRRFGAPKVWTDPVARTDAEGRAELRFVPPRAYSFLLYVELEGHADAIWSWSEIGLDETVDLGTVRLEAVGTIVGTVVDTRGNVLTRGWSAYAIPKASFERGRSTFSQHGTVDPASGEFRLEGVPAGAASVRGRGLGASTDAVEVQVVAGVETLVEIVYDGPDLGRRVVVRVRTPFWVYPYAAATRLISSDGSFRLPGTDGRSASLVFDDVSEGTYRVEIDDPLYEPWAQDGVRPGESVTANLQPAGCLALDVVDAATGRAFAYYGVGTVLQDNARRGERELLRDGSPAPDDGVLTGVMPVAQTLVVRVPGRPVQRVELDGPWPEGAREVRVLVGPSRRQVGRVVDATGRPLAGVRVERTTELSRSGPEQRWKTDLNGEFGLDDVPSGTHTFRAICNPWLETSATVELPVPPDQELVLEVPASGRLRGLLQLPETVAADDVALDFSGSAAGFQAIWGRIARDGTFDVGPLPVGELPVATWRRVTAFGGYESFDRRTLGTIEVRPGETTFAEWDLRGEITGSARLALRVDGKPGAGVRVWALRESTESSAAGIALPDEPGRIFFTDLAPGSWSLALQGPDRAWTWWSTESFAVEAARETAVELDLKLHRRRVRIVDAESGAPLVAVEVTASTGPRDWRAGRTRGTTDDAGELELVLPPGEVRFSLARKPYAKADDSVAVEWGEGEDVIEVRLPGSER